MTKHDTVRSAGIDIKWRYLFRNDAFAIPCVASLCEVIHCCKLNECRKHKGIAHRNKPIHSGGIGHLGERIPCADAQSSHCQDSCHSCKANGFSGFRSVAISCASFLKCYNRWESLVFTANSHKRPHFSC